MKIYFSIFEVPLGWMGLIGGEKGIQRIYLPMARQDGVRARILAEYPEGEERGDFFQEEMKQIKEYFSGLRKEFSFALDFSTATPFQRRVYEILLSIPFGEVRTYGWVAEKTGNPQALRAVGGANARNKWPLVVACHRVVGCNGFLTGFSAAGGLELKAALLKIEGIQTGEKRVQGFKGPGGQGGDA